MTDDLLRQLEKWESERPDPDDQRAWRRWLEAMPEEPYTPPQQTVRKDAHAADLVYKVREDAAAPQPAWRSEPDYSVELRQDMTNEEFEEAFRRKWTRVLVDAVQVREFVNRRQDIVDGDLDAVDARIDAVEVQLGDVFAQLAELNIRLNALEQNQKDLRPILQRKIRGA
jgi:hypothetical protein